MDHRRTVPVPGSLLRPLWIGLAGAAVSFAVTTVQGIVRQDYDAWQQAVSALSLGPRGWIQMVNLVAFGVVVLTTVRPWRRLLVGGTGAVAYPVLTALVGASFMLVGLVAQDPAPGYDPANLHLRAPTPSGLVHLAIAGVAALSSVICLLVMAVRFAGDDAWRRWSFYSAGAAVAMVGCVTIYGVWSIRSSGFAGTFERGAMLVPMLWTFAFLSRLRRGTPFVIAHRPKQLTPEI